MTNLTALDKAVYNECGPLVCRLIWEDAQHYGLSVLEKRWPVLMRCIRARYRQIVAEGGYMLPQEVHDLDAGPSRIIQRS